MEQMSFEWSDKYNIGVEEIDTAHRRLFSVVNRIINNFMDSDFEKNKTMCIEAIKYLKSYALKHFGEEEAYMLKIKYPNYKNHRKIHDNMRDIIIPALEKEVAMDSYSKQSLEHFAGACAGWLAAHVLFEDLAIAGKVQSKWNININEDSEYKLDKIVKDCVLDLFSMKAELTNKNYVGFKLSKLFCYKTVLKGSDKTEYACVTAIEESLLNEVMKGLVSKEASELSDVMLAMIREMFKTFNIKVVGSFLNKSLKITDDQILSDDSFYSIYANVYPDYSMLWRTRSGYIAFELRKVNGTMYN